MRGNFMTNPLVAAGGRRLIAGFAAGSALFLSACGSSPAVRYFTLQGPVDQRTSSTLTADAMAARSVQLVSLSVPEAVDRPQLVLRTGDNTVRVDELARWAEPLKRSLSGVLAAEMMQALGGAPVLLRSGGSEETAWKLSVDVLRFDARQGQDVALEAVWSLRSRSDGKSFSRRSVAQETVAGESLEAIVAAQSRAVASLARDVARLVEEQARLTESGMKPRAGAPADR